MITFILLAVIIWLLIVNHQTSMSHTSFSGAESYDSTGPLPADDLCLPRPPPPPPSTPSVPSPSSAPPLPSPPVINDSTPVLQAGHMIKLQSLPATRLEVVGNVANERKPYLIDLVKDANSWIRFTTKFLTSNDVLIALVGWSSSGKTSIFKALLGLAFEDAQLPILPSVNTTVLPVVAWLKTVKVDENTLSRIWIVDLPGAGAEGQSVTNGSGTRFVLNSAVTLLSLIRQKVGCVFFVQKDAAVDDQQKAYYETFRKSGIHMRVIYNAAATVKSDVEIGKQAIRDKLMPKEPLVVCHAVTCHTYDDEDRKRLGYDVASLKALLEEQTKPAVLAREGMTIGTIKVPVEKKTKNETKKETKKEGSTSKASSTDGLGALPDGTDVGVTALAGVAAWLPGAAWYGVYAGPLLLTTPVGLLLAGPVTGVAVVSGAVYAARRYNAKS